MGFSFVIPIPADRSAEEGVRAVGDELASGGAWADVCERELHTLTLLSQESHEKKRTTYEVAVSKVK